MDPRRPFARALFLGAYLPLAGLQWLWHGVLAPTHPALVALAVLPLLIPIAWMFGGPAPRATVLATYLSLFYFVHGVTEALVSAEQRVLAVTEVSLCLALYVLLVLQRPRRGVSNGP